jgi:hypothetical protein
MHYFMLVQKSILQSAEPAMFSYCLLAAIGSDVFIFRVNIIVFSKYGFLNHCFIHLQPASIEVPTSPDSRQCVPFEFLAGRSLYPYEMDTFAVSV